MLRKFLLSLVVLTACAADVSSADLNKDSEIATGLAILTKRMDDFETLVRAREPQSHRANPLAGIFTGKCRNNTVRVDGDVTLFLNIEHGDYAVSGAVVISNGLYGTGIVQGRVEGNSIVLVSTSLPSPIVWHGSITETGIEGTYYMPENPWLRTALQTGTWAVKRWQVPVTAPAAKANPRQQ